MSKNTYIYVLISYWFNKGRKIQVKNNLCKIYVTQVVFYVKRIYPRTLTLPIFLKICLGIFTGCYGNKQTNKQVETYFYFDKNVTEKCYFKIIIQTNLTYR